MNIKQILILMVLAISVILIYVVYTGKCPKPAQLAPTGTEQTQEMKDGEGLER